MQVYIKLSIVLVTISLFTINDVKSVFNDWRIVGGVKAYRGEFPHQLLILKDDLAVCSASLIDNQWALTAAHCFTLKDGPNPQINGRENFTIRIGEYNIEDKDPNKYDLKIKKIIIHPKWSSSTRQNDIALIELNEKINYTQNIRKIDLAKNSDHLEGQLCTVSGWGDSGTEGEVIVIRKAVLPIIDNKRCDKEWKSYENWTQIFEGQICGGDLPDISACNGDSGGPLQCQIKGHNLLVGIISGGNDRCHNHKYDLSEIPNVFTRVSYYYDWIESQIQYNRSD